MRRLRTEWSRADIRTKFQMYEFPFRRLRACLSRGETGRIQRQPGCAPEQPFQCAPSETREVKFAPETAAEGEVWLNTRSRKHFKPGSRFYGKTKQGKFMTESADVINAMSTNLLECGRSPLSARCNSVLRITKILHSMLAMPADRERRLKV